MKKLNDDVVGITDAEGNMIASYSYDEWGKLLSIETTEENNVDQLAVAEMNPFRYRGYYYDNETGMYYLQSRYYNPDLCRFISADSFNYINNSQVLNLNAYAYCINNPIIYSDPSGNSPISDRFVNVLIKIVNKFDCLVDKTKQKFEDFKLKIQGVKDNLKSLMEKAKVDILNYNFSAALKTLSIKNIFNCIFDYKKSIVSTLPNMPTFFANATETVAAVITEIFVILDLEELSKEVDIELDFKGFDDYKKIKAKIYQAAYEKGKISVVNLLLSQITSAFNNISSIATAALDAPSLGWVSWVINIVDDCSGKYGKGGGYAAILDTSASLCIFTVAGAVVVAGNPIVGGIIGVAGSILYNEVLRDIVEEFAYYYGWNWYLEK